jgi:Mce-associated membrane protein
MVDRTDESDSGTENDPDTGQGEQHRKEADAMSTTTTETTTEKAAATTEDVNPESRNPESDKAPESTDSGATASETSTGGSTGGSSRWTNRSFSTRSILVTLAVVAAIAVIAVLSWQLVAARSEVDDLNAASADRTKAEQVALDYATGAAQMSFENPDDWRSRLTKGTTPELGDRLDKASTSMEQLIKPLQWSSTAQPISAKVESESGGVYQVQAFVNVFTKNAQAPDGIESTATYKMTIDKNNDWVITDISGIGSNLGGQAAPK